ncbi:DNA gyrase subunit A, partial [Larkinella sp. C7]
NLGEAIDAVKLVMDKPEATTKEIMEVMPGPDFPTGALVMGKSGIHRAYETGKGSIVLRSRTEIETTKSGRERIVVT